MVIFVYSHFTFIFNHFLHYIYIYFFSIPCIYANKPALSVNLMTTNFQLADVKEVQLCISHLPKQKIHYDLIFLIV